MSHRISSFNDLTFCDTPLFGQTGEILPETGPHNFSFGTEE